MSTTVRSMDVVVDEIKVAFRGLAGGRLRSRWSEA